MKCSSKDLTLKIKLDAALFWDLIHGYCFRWWHQNWSFFKHDQFQITTYSRGHMLTDDFQFMKQKCYFLRGVAECRHAATPMSSYSINTTLQGFQKRYITLLYLKGLKSYQLSKFKCLHFTPLSLVNWTFHLLFSW